MNLAEINWNPNAAGTWPLAIKAVITATICAIVFAVGVYLDTIGQLDELEKSERKEVDLKKTFEEKQKKAVNLSDHLDQLKQIEVSLDEMIRQMPTEEEVASLLVDISQTGLANGLEFKLFKPNPPVRKEFYSELPISIEVNGTYKELGSFISGLAALPRIVTIHDVLISPEKTVGNNKNTEKNADGEMLMKATIKTYNEGSNVPAAPSKKDKDKDKKNKEKK
jgi:type IV pilus assembly protein PilO